MVESGEFVEIYINRAVSTATGAMVKCLLRPDIIGKTTEGLYKLVEVVSKTQNTIELQLKIEQLIRLFANLAATGMVIE